MTKEVKIYNRIKTVSSISDAQKTRQLHGKEMKLEYSLTPYTKMNSKYLNTVKLLEENIHRTH